MNNLGYDPETRFVLVRVVEEGPVTIFFYKDTLDPKKRENWWSKLFRWSKN